jgi:hypothetical protein
MKLHGKMLIPLGLWIILAGCQSTESVVPVVNLPPAPPLHFVDVSDRISVDAPRGRGVALVDFDGDSWPDITVSIQEGVLRFRNRGDGTFELFGELLKLEFVQAVTWVDVDGDADLDLYLTSLGTEHRLYKNDGAGVLLDVTSAAGIGPQTIGAQGATFADIDGDEDLDLYIATGPIPEDFRVGSEIPGTSGGPNRLYLNDGDGNFTFASGVVTGHNDGESFQGAFFDYDRDGDLDLFIADDYIPDTLFENDGTGNFTNVSSGVLPRGGVEETSSMGVAIADIDGDGAFELYATQREKDLLYRWPAGDGQVEDSFPQYIGTGYDPTAQVTGWGVALVDFDNDGDVDILQTSNFETVFDPFSDASALRAGWLLAIENRIQEPERGILDVSDAVGDVFYRPLDGWGLAVGDIDKDGDQDVLIGIDGTASSSDSDAWKKTLLLLNDGQRVRDNKSIRLRIRQSGPNPFAVGAEVRILGRGIETGHPIAAGTSFLSQNEYVVHFGLGEYEVAPAVEVRWPDGQRTLYGPLTAGEHTLVRPGAGNCCIGDLCQNAPADACLTAMGAWIKTTDHCQASCQTLSECCGAAFDTEGCISSCARLSPPASVAACLQSATCEEIQECIGERYLFIDGEIECSLEEEGRNNERR